MKKYFTSNNGIVLLASTLGVFLLLSLFAFVLARVSLTEARTGSYYFQDVKARNLSLVGLELGMHNFVAEHRKLQVASGNLNNGTYSVSFDSLYDESGNRLPWDNYVMLKSKGVYNDVVRNTRIIASSFPEAFCFTYYCDNADNETFTEDKGIFKGDIFFKGDVSANSIQPLTGTVYNISGVGATALPDYPKFPELDFAYFQQELLLASQLPTTENILKSNDTIYLTDYPNNYWIVKGTVELNNCLIVGPGEIIVDGELKLTGGTHVSGRNIHFIASDKMLIKHSTIGNSAQEPALIYSAGQLQIQDVAVIYGFIISAGSNLMLDDINLYGALLNYSPNTFTNQNTKIHGSLVSKYNIRIQDSNSLFEKSHLPQFFNKKTGLNPVVIPGTYLEF